MVKRFRVTCEAVFNISDYATVTYAYNISKHYFHNVFLTLFILDANLKIKGCMGNCVDFGHQEISGMNN